MQNTWNGFFLHQLCKSYSQKPEVYRLRAAEHMANLWHGFYRKLRSLPTSLPMHMTNRLPFLHILYPATNWSFKSWVHAGNQISIFHKQQRYSAYTTFPSGRVERGPFSPLCTWSASVQRGLWWPWVNFLLQATKQINIGRYKPWQELKYRAVTSSKHCNDGSAVRRISVSCQKKK